MGEWQKGLVSAKSFGLSSAKMGVDAGTKLRRKSLDVQPDKEESEKEDAEASGNESVDSFFTKPKEELFQKKEEPAQPKEPSMPIILTEKQILK